MRGINTAANFKFSLWFLRQFLLIRNNGKKNPCSQFYILGISYKTVRSQWDRKINQPRNIRNSIRLKVCMKIISKFSQCQTKYSRPQTTLKYHWKKNQLAMFYCMTVFCWQCFTYSVLLIMFYLGSLYLEPDSLVTWWRRIKGTELSSVVDLVEWGHMTGKKRQDLVTRGNLILKSDRKLRSIFFYLC